MGLICAGILQGLNTSNVLHSRVLYVSLSILMALICLFIRLFSESLSDHISFFSLCKSGDCISQTITHAAMFSLSLFHLVVLVLTVINKQFSAMVYQECWPMKFVIFLALLFISILANSVLVIAIQEYYFFFAVVFSFIYLVIQCIYTIELAYDWNDSWFNNYTQTQDSVWGFLLFGSSGVCWILMVYFVVLSYSHDCFIFFLMFFVLSLIITAVSCSSLCENGSLLSASLTFSAAFYYLTVGFVLNEKDLDLGTVIADVIFSFIILVYIALVYHEGSSKKNEVKITELKDFNKYEESKIDNEREIEELENYRNFQLVLMCYALFLGMVLTNWEKRDYGEFPKVVRVSQACVLAMFYVWTLAAPYLFPDRDFNR